MLQLDIFFNTDNTHDCIECISIEACTTPTDLLLLISFQFTDLLLDGHCIFKTGSHNVAVVNHLTYTNIPLNDIDLNNLNYYVQCPLCPDSEYHINTFLRSKIYTYVAHSCYYNI